MSFLRTLPTRRLIALVAVLTVVAAGGTALAIASGGGEVPPAKPLANAAHDALAAPQVAGVTAHITFTNKLIDSSSLEGGAGPLLSGATGRLWLGDGGRVRLELQSDRGDAQIVSDGTHAWAYDPGSRTVYRATLPQETTDAKDAHTVPSVSDIQRSLDRLMQRADVSGAEPGNVGGRPAYTVRVSPKHDGGLLGAGEVAWDSAHGVPLRAAVYAQGSRSPVLELAATNISYRSVPASDFLVSPPSDAKVVTLDGPSGAKGADTADKSASEPAPVTGASAVAKAVPFTLAAPGTLVGLPRHDVRLADWKGNKAAIVTYGRGLGGIVVIEQAAQPAGTAAPRQGAHRDHGGLTLPKVSINGATGQELDTALGTMVTFENGGVAYTVLGSVPAAAAEAAARGLR